MPWFSRFFLRMLVMAWLALAPTLAHAAQGSIRPDASPINIEGLGKGTANLDGPWRFRTGDSPAWAHPGFDDSAWALLSADKPWGSQGYARYTGFAWYRCSLVLTPAPGVASQFSLLLPSVFDAYEVYWNGALIGRNGILEPRPIWYASESPQVFQLGQAQRGVLAIRVWKAPLLSDDSGTEGGFEAVPEIGSPEAIATAKASLEYKWLHRRQFMFGENLLYALVAVLSFLIWTRNSSRWPLFWMAGFAAVSPLNLMLLNAHLRLPYALAMGADQPLASIRDISLWFLLVWLLLLHENYAVVRLTRLLAWVNLVNSTLDGVLLLLIWNPHWIGLLQTADALSAFEFSLLQTYPLVLVGYAFLQRKRLDFGRWIVASLAFLDEMILVVRNISKQGRQFTDWSFAAKLDAPLFAVGGSAISLYTLTGALLLVSIVYVVYNSILEDQRRQAALEREKLELTHAREQMRHHAEHDGLTGLWNHRIIVDRLTGELERSRRDRTPLSVILTDIDHFKKINDNFGHTTGDQVLREISTIFARHVRTYDWVGRYGGEEFLIILPGSELDSALIRAEELREAVQAAEIVDGETKLRVTASFGVASGFAGDCEAETVIRTVDAALYRAKSSGRNRVIAAETDMQLCES